MSRLDVTKGEFEFRTYRKTATARAVQMDRAFSVIGPNGTTEGVAGDYLMEGAPGDRWACGQTVFESSYQEAGPPVHDFGFALSALRAGKRVARSGWNGKGMWLALSPGTLGLPAERFWAGPNREYAESKGGAADVLPCITMKTATGEILMGWLASQTDMLATDWTVVS